MPELLTSRRLDQPQPGRVRLSYDPELFGQISERIARFLGTGKFLFWMTVFVASWITINLVAARYAWDPYPFILLNLFFSTQASYAAPLILLAQNRQEARDRVTLERDREQAAQSRADMDYLAREIAGLRMSVGELATRDYVRSELRNELRSILADLADLDDDDRERDRDRDRDRDRERERNG